MRQYYTSAAFRIERLWDLIDTFHALMLPVEYPGFLPLLLADPITPGITVFEFNVVEYKLVCMIAYPRFELDLADVSSLDRLTDDLRSR